MKKISFSTLALAAVLLALTGCSNLITEAPAAGAQSIVPASESRALTLPTSNILYLENFTDLRLFAGAGAEILYSSSQEMGYSNLYIHYGFNGWQSVADAPISITNPSSPYLTGKINIPSWATSFDYVFYSVQPNGTKLWDNNRGRDWHAQVFTSSVETLTAGTYVTVYYISKFPAATVHWGTNGWTNIKDTVMTKSQSLPSGYNKFSVNLTPAAATDLINFCFTNGTGGWDNNGGQNWLTSVVSTLRTDVYTTNNGAFLQSDIAGEPIKAYLEGKFMGTFSFAPTTSSFYGSYTGQAGNWKYVLDVVKNGIRYTGTATKLVNASGSVGMTINTQTWNQ